MLGDTCEVSDILQVAWAYFYQSAFNHWLNVFVLYYKLGKILLHLTGFESTYEIIAWISWMEFFVI